ncbi:hypothetical protein J5J83_11360, partial [Azoarcus sp. L1K30]|nr:hypothetical protein [Azoarcus sp. L1K30]
MTESPANIARTLARRGIRHTDSTRPAHRVRYLIGALVIVLHAAGLVTIQRLVTKPPLIPEARTIELALIRAEAPPQPRLTPPAPEPAPTKPPPAVPKVQPQRTPPVTKTTKPAPAPPAPPV